MTIEKVIRLAGMIERGNVLPEELAMEFLSEFDGMIQSDIMLYAPEEIIRYDSKDQELILRPPHDGLYLSFLVAMIRQCQGEFEGYNNAQEIVEDKLKTFRRWYISHYRPADTGSRDYTGGTSGGAFGFAYLSAYGLAVKHGYQGSEEEWLESLKGEKGDAGAAARMRYDAERDMIQWGVGDEWQDLYTMAQVLAPLYAKLEELTGRAETAAGNAENAAGTAAAAAEAASSNAALAQQARTDAQAAAESAAAAEQSTAQMRDEVRSNLQDAETAAQAAQEAAAALKKPLPQLTLATAREDDGDNGVILTPEGTAEKPVLNLYGLNGDEPVIVRNAAAAERDDDLPTLGQVREMIGQNDTVGGGGYVASDEPPEDTGALWVDTSEAAEAVALGVTAVETDEGVEFYCTDEIGTTKVSLRHGKDGKDSGENAALTADQISALHELFLVCAFTNADVSPQLSAFREAFGITDSGGSGGEDSGGNDGDVSNEVKWTDGVAYSYEAVENEYVDTDGTFTAYDGWNRTPYLYCKDATVLRAVVNAATSLLGMNNSYHAFYDESKNFIERFSVAGIDNNTVGSYMDIEVPANAAYFVASHKAGAIGTSGTATNALGFVPYSEVPV